MKTQDRFRANSDEHFYARAIGLVVKIANPVDVAYKVVMMAFAFAFVGTVAWFLYERADRTPPSDIIGVRLLTPKVTPGDDVKVAFSIVRNRICQIDIGYETLDGMSVVHLGPTSHKDAGGPIGPDYFVRRFPVPKDSTPGKGSLRVTWSWQCPGNPTQTIDPIVRVFQFDFDIIAPP